MLEDIPSSLDDLFERGVSLFNAGEFYDCHDVLEEAWLQESSDERLFLQGLIQAAVAFYHLESGRLGAARSMLARSGEKLVRYPDVYRGILLAPFLNELREWKSKLDRAIQSKDETGLSCAPPRIRRVS